MKSIALKYNFPIISLTIHLLSVLIIIPPITKPSSALTNEEVDEAIEREKMRLPEFYFTNSIQECSLDSPELYFEEVALPSLKALIQEGKTFFGVLLDNLDEALNEDDVYDKLKTDWEYLTDVLLVSFDDRQRSITWLWKKFISTVETRPLPWEVWSKKTVLIEIIGALHYDYLVLEAAIRMAVKEIVLTSLKQPFTRIMKEVDKEMETRLGNGAPDGDTLVQNMEKTLKEIEPNFIGQLLAGMLGRARQKTNGIWKEVPVFITQPIEHIGLLVVAFRDKSEEYSSSFWKDMTNIMKDDLVNNSLINNIKNNANVNVTTQNLFRMYSVSQERVIRNVMYLLTPKEEI